MGVAAILAVGLIMINFIIKNHQKNTLLIENCFNHLDNVETIVIKKDSFWLPVTCEKN